MSEGLSPFRLTIVATIAVICLAGAIAFVLITSEPNANVPQDASILFGFLAPTIVGLLALMRSEQNAAALTSFHSQNQQSFEDVSGKIDGIGQAASESAKAAAIAAVATAAELTQHPPETPPTT